MAILIVIFTQLLGPLLTVCCQQASKINLTRQSPTAVTEILSIIATASLYTPD